MTPKQRLMATLRGEARDRVAVTPIVMQWAAHYIKRSFRDYYLDGRILAEGQLAVQRGFESDWVSVMSDPWCESSAFGMTFDWPEEHVGVPHHYLIRERDDVKKLAVFDPHTSERPRQRLECIRAEKAALGDKVAVCGWVEGPIAQYSDLRDLQPACIDLIDDPLMFHEAAEVIVESALGFARAQVAAGADVIGVGDAAASVIGPELYREHVLPWERKLIDGIHALGVPVKLHICGNIAPLLPDLARVGTDMLDVDWMVPLQQVRAIMGQYVTLCGNFNPIALLEVGNAPTIRDTAAACVENAGGPRSRFILQPGCEVPVGTPDANLRAFCPWTWCAGQG